MKKLTLLISILAIVQLANAQITFQKTYGFGNGYSVQQTFDGGYIIAGSSSHVYLIKTDSTGDTLWTRSFGGINYDAAFSLKQTTDSGYIITGQTESFGAGQNDAYLLKTDPNGILLWSKTFGMSLSEATDCVWQTADGGYILSGRTMGYNAGILIKTDGSGNLLWNKYYQIGTLHPLSVQQITDGGFIISGYVEGSDAILIKTDSVGDILWTKLYGGMYEDQGYFVQQTNDGGFIMTGSTRSFGAGPTDVYLIKTDSNGDTLWTKAYGTNFAEAAKFVQQTTDGGYIIAGRIDPLGTFTLDAYLIKTDSTGNLLWSKNYGGITHDYANSLRQTTDGGYIITGVGNLSKIYLIKTDANGNSGCNEGIPNTIVSPTTTHVLDTVLTILLGNPTISTPATVTESGGTITTLCTTVGTNELTTANSFFIVPNPSTGNFEIKFSEIIKKKEIEIYNVLGKKVFEEKIYNDMKKEISLGNITAGIYFVKVFDGGKSYCKKLIVE